MKVLKKFRDKYTNKIYLPGIEFHCDDEKRIADLQNRELIEQTEPKHVGGGYYELPDGTRVKGKQSAFEAMDGDTDVIQGND